MADSTISAMDHAQLPLTSEAVPCVQDQVNKQASALAFGIPGTGHPPLQGLSEFQTWIDDTVEPAQVYMYINGGWVALYTIAQDGSLAISKTLAMPGSPTDDLDVATKQYVDDTRSALPYALIYKNTIDCSTNPNYPAADLGHFYIVSGAGRIGGASGANVAIGDSLLCRVDGTLAGTQAGAGLNWTIGQGKLQNIAVGPGTAVSGDFAQFDGTSGTLLKDGGLSLDTDRTMAANSDSRIPSQKAVKSQIGGQPLSGDTLAQGQAWLWDAPSASFRAGDCVGQNLLINPAFGVWQETSTYTLNPTVPQTYIADFWKVGGGTTGGRIVCLNRVSLSAFNGPYFTGVQFIRPPGATDTGRFRLVQQYNTPSPLANNTVMVSFDFMVGANYSPTNGPFVTFYWASNSSGQGVGNLDLRSSSPQFIGSTTGVLASPSLAAQVAPYGTIARIVAGPFTIPAKVSRSTDTTIVAVEISSGDYTGASGSDDSYMVGNVKVESGNIVTPFHAPDYSEELRRCQRRYQSTFLYGPPAAGIGNNTGEFLFRRFGAGSASEGAYIPLFGAMDRAPTVTLYNPSLSSSSDVHNATKNADCSASAVDQICDHGFRVTCTGNSTGVAGDWLSVHYVADARV